MEETSTAGTKQYHINSIQSTDSVCSVHAHTESLNVLPPNSQMHSIGIIFTGGDHLTDNGMYVTLSLSICHCFGDTVVVKLLN